MKLPFTKTNGAAQHPAVLLAAQALVALVPAVCVVQLLIRNGHSRDNSSPVGPALARGRGMPAFVPLSLKPATSKLAPNSNGYRFDLWLRVPR